MPVLAAGGALAASGVGLGLARTCERDFPRVAVLSSAFFTLSLVHIPAPGMHVHLVLCGLMGVLLGWAAFPAVAVALVLQAALFGHGGLTALGVNIVSMAAPGIVLAWACRPLLDPDRADRLSAGGFLIGFGSVVLSGWIAALAVVASGRPLWTLGTAVLVAHLFLGLLEGALTASILAYVGRARPELLTAAARTGSREVAHG
jgi:cobalt/nickel transport system permease protein